MPLTPFLREWVFFAFSPREAAMQEEGRKFPFPFCPGLLFRAWVLLWALVLTAPGEGAPARIISLSPAVTEILFLLGEGGRVVGVTDFCQYPPEAARLPKVGGFLNPSYETMLSLMPDLLIHQKDSAGIANFARQAGFGSLAVSMLTLEEIFTTIETLGTLVGKPAAAAKAVEELQATLARRREALAPLARKSVFLLLGVGNDPVQTLYGVGPNTYLGELLALAGGDNVLSPSLSPYPKINKEFIIAQSPEVIIEVGPVPLDEEEIALTKVKWQRFTTVRAVKNDAIHFLGGGELLIPGPRLNLVLDRFIRALHPELKHEAAAKKGSP